MLLINVPPNAPSTTPTFQQANRPRPHAQYAARRRRGSDCDIANAVDSSINTWLPTMRRSQPVPMTSPIASPKGRCLAFTRRPATTAAIGLPPAPTIATNMNWDAPANTTTESSIGSQIGKPVVTAIAPKDSPTRPSARHTRAMSRPSPPGERGRRRIHVMFAESNAWLSIVNTEVAFVKSNVSE